MRRAITEERRKRMDSVYELFGILGLSVAETAEVLGIKKGVVRYDLKRLGGEKDLSHRPTNAQRFAHAFKCYAELERKSRWIRLSKEDRRLESVYAMITDMKNFKEFVRGVQETMSLLLNPQHSSSEKGYAQLLRAIFGVRVRLVWDEYLDEIVKESTPLPRNKREIEDAARGYINKYRPEIAPIWPEGEIPKALETALATLTEREQKVIRMRFGIGIESATLKTLGKEFELNQERIRQIELKALRKLRHPSRSRSLRKFVEPIGDALRQRIYKEAQEKALQESAGSRVAYKETKTTTEWLQSSVFELALSTRADSCLKKAWDIKTISDLVKKPEGELLKIRGMGKRSLNEIKGLLLELGLRLEMSEKELP